MNKKVECCISDTEQGLKPFIRWAGGKQNLVSHISPFISNLRINRYFEPFLGGGSIFLNGSFTNAYLSDLNPNLINCYTQIKNCPQTVYTELMKFPSRVTPDIYYSVRRTFNENIGENSVLQAARFLFLNKTSFNGIYRVNKKGIYNVPFGKENPSYPTFEHLQKISIKLSSASLTFGYYDEIESQVANGDFIYLDPPYPKLSNTSYFNHYTLDRFDNVEQIKLSYFANRISAKGCKILISNADIPEIRNLYKNWDIRELTTYRFITCKKQRMKVRELIIKNY